MMSILLGFVGALFIGSSDCIARVTTQKVSSVILILFIMGVSVAGFILWFILFGNWPQWNSYAWATSALSGIMNIMALSFLYTALARGPVAVASPAASSFTVILVGLNIIAGYPATFWQVTAITIVFLGVAMLSRQNDSDTIANSDIANQPSYSAAHLRITAFYGLAAALTIACRMFLAQEAGDAIGAMHAVFLNRFFALLTAMIVLLFMIIKKSPLKWPTPNLLPLITLQAISESLALSLFLYGSQGDGRIGATIGFSTFAMITSLIAWVWLGEKISKQRLVWIIIITGGIMMAVLVA